jgi:flagellar protein FliJ
MPRFKFRLEAALRLAERALEDQQRRLAIELEKLHTLQARCRERETNYQLSLEGQQNAGKNAPQDLARWQTFACKQLELLRSAERETSQQEKVVALERQHLIEAHQEKEKLQKLKEKQKAQFDLTEQRREQVILDEAGQVIFGRRNLE